MDAVFEHYAVLRLGAARVAAAVSGSGFPTDTPSVQTVPEKNVQVVPLESQLTPVVRSSDYARDAFGSKRLQEILYSIKNGIPCCFPFLDKAPPFSCSNGRFQRDLGPTEDFRYNDGVSFAEAPFEVIRRNSLPISDAKASQLLRGGRKSR